MSKEILYTIMVASGVGSIIALGYAQYQLYKANKYLYKAKMKEEEQYWEQKGYDDKCWGYVTLDFVWDKDKKEHPKKHQNSYRLGQWRAYEEGKSFKNEKPYFDKPKQR